jgi:predicted ferric reductase
MATVTSQGNAWPDAATRKRRPKTSPSAPAPRPWVLQVAIIALAIGFGATIALAVTDTTWSQVKAPGGAWIFLGSLTGLAGTYLALVMVLLVSRVPAVERVLGQDGLLAWHRRLAPWPISLISAHVVFVTIGYAQTAKTGFWHEFGVLTNTFPQVLPATIGFFIMVAIAVVSIRAIRQRIPRERWWALHLFMYLALAISFAHVIVLGPSFVGHPLTQLLWIAIWLATAGLVLTYRIGLPIMRSMRHRLEVVEVREEAPGVVTVICRGERLERLAVSGGQFFEWRFLARGMWWQAHPFSLSALPRPPYLRLTVKVVGDFTAAVARLRPGTRIAIEGPYGAFTSPHRERQKAALIAGGVGVTAVRSLLEDLPRGCEPVVVLRASRPEDVVFSEEVAELVRQRKGRVHELVGARSEVNLRGLIDIIPDLRQRDVFVAGPEQFVLDVCTTLTRLGVSSDATHAEIYSL